MVRVCVCVCVWPLPRCACVCVRVCVCVCLCAYSCLYNNTRSEVAHHTLYVGCYLQQARFRALQPLHLCLLRRRLPAGDPTILNPLRILILLTILTLLTVRTFLNLLTLCTLVTRSCNPNNACNPFDANRRVCRPKLPLWRGTGASAA
jgi:hypothetical protein